MSLLLSEDVPWSNRRWFTTIVLLSAGQIVLIVDLTQTDVSPRRKGNTAPRIQMISSAAYESSEKSLGSRDPTLFALAHPQGFSGAAWLRGADFPYEQPNLMQSAQPLAPDPENLAQQFMQFIQRRSGGTSFLLSKLAPRPEEVPYPAQPLVLRPRVTIDGDLRNRRLLAATPLPPPDPEKILTNCVVSVTVASNGDLLSATLLSSSGSPATDAAALAFARTARFTPWPARSAVSGPTPFDAVFGRLIFQWLQESTEVRTPSPAFDGYVR